MMQFIENLGRYIRRVMSWVASLPDRTMVILKCVCIVLYVIWILDEKKNG
jgi:hypothetical protein